MPHRRRALVAFTVAVAAIVAGVAPSPAATRTRAQAAPDDLVVQRVAELAFATGMQFTPSGDRLFVNERHGDIRIIERGRLLPQPFASVETTSRGEGGLLGLALHPRFEQGEPWVYVFYTRSDGEIDRVERFHADASGTRADRRDVVIDNLPAGFYHHGGIVLFGPDGKLYVSNGEAHVRERAQNPRVLGGKIYRLEPDGRIPSDNPFRGSPAYSYGHRNPFGLAFDPRTGNLWETENGPSDHDEVNLIRREANYGWPIASGRAGNSRFVDPLIDYVKIIVPTMMAFGPDALPAGYRGDLFFGAYAQGAIHRLTLTSDRRRVQRDEIFMRVNSVVGMTAGPDGLYYTTPEGVFRIAAKSSPSPSPSAVATTPAQRGEHDDGGTSRAPALVLVGALALGLGLTIALLVRRARR